MNILIVEDDIQSAQVIEQFIETWGHKGQKAENGEVAITKFKKDSFDLVLLDIFLPDIEGYDLIPQFKEIDPGIGIVTMTGQNTRDLEAKVRRQGILYYMTKPLEKKNLKTLLDHISERNLSNQKNL